MRPPLAGAALAAWVAAALSGCGAPPPAPPAPGSEPPPEGLRTQLPAATDEGPACAPPAPGAPGPGTPGPPAPRIPVVLGKPGVPAPADEIPFSHKAHAGDCKIPCLACHVYAEKSPVAGLPSGRKCMGCHKFVAKEKPAVQVLAARVKAGQPLRWTRVFSLPDFVHFTHRVHLLHRDKDVPPEQAERQRIQCKDCHGDVAAMKVVHQDEPFTMGRCLACHEERKAPKDCVVCHK